jgi:hypothetical protein
MSESVFLIGDPRRYVSQPVQQTIMREYAKSQSLLVDFVGWEIGLWGQHKMLDSYAASRKSDSFLFFTIYQFQAPEGFQTKKLKKLFESGYNLYFASQRISVRTREDLVGLLAELFVVERMLSSESVSSIL